MKGCNGVMWGDVKELVAKKHNIDVTGEYGYLPYHAGEKSQSAKTFKKKRVAGGERDATTCVPTYFSTPALYSHHVVALDVGFGATPNDVDNGAESAFTWIWLVFLILLVFIYHIFVYSLINATKNTVKAKASKEEALKMRTLANAELFFANLRVKYAKHETTSWFNKHQQLMGFTDIKAPLAIQFAKIKAKLKNPLKTVVDDVSGELPPGAMAAVMGASGSGMTSLLNAMTMRASEYTYTTGVVSVGGIRHALLHYPAEVGFVTQDNIMHPDLTVYESLRFQALLRLPAAMAIAQKEAIIEDVLDILELTHVRDTLCGDAMTRGISAGEKKRLSIGMELVAYPRVLFLDEPTSGVDAYEALEVVRFGEGEI